MTTRKTRAGRSSTVTRVASEVVTFAHDSGRQRITPARRWELIRKAAYQRAQNRESLESYPDLDLLEAERKVDALYETDFECLLAVDDSVEFADQLRGLLACYGIAQKHLDELLDKHLERLQWLIAQHREGVAESAELTAKQVQALRAIVGEAKNALQSLSTGQIDSKALLEFAEDSMDSIETVFAAPQGAACLEDETIRLHHHKS